MNHTIKELIQDNIAVFSFYQEGKAYYTITIGNELYEFPVPIDEVGNGILLRSDKAIYFMKWIQNAVVNQTMRMTTRIYECVTSSGR